jgi:hypothetical protein
MWNEVGAGGEICAFVHITLRIKVEDMWSEPIEGIGGSMLVAAEKSGLHTSDEAYKMATTDALSVAMKQLGVAADIYLGNYDGTKYKGVEPGDNVVSMNKNEARLISEAERKLLDSMARNCTEPDAAAGKVYEFLGVKKFAEIKATDMKTARNILEGKEPDA